MLLLTGLGREIAMDEVINDLNPTGGAIDAIRHSEVLRIIKALLEMSIQNSLKGTTSAPISLT